MFRRTLIAALAAGLITVFTASTAAAAPVTTSGNETDKSAAQTQKFTLIQNDPEKSGGPIAATGPIHAKGTDVVISNSKDRFKFPAGNVVIKHKRDKGNSVESFDPVTCLFSFSEHGTWKTVSGTGAYTNVNGSGTYHVLGQGFGCNQNKPPKVFILRIVAKGPLSY